MILIPLIAAVALIVAVEFILSLFNEINSTLKSPTLLVVPGES